MIHYGGYGQRGFAVHEPGRQIGAVAAEVVESTGAILRGIGKPVSEIQEAADLFRALVAVLDNDAAELAQAAVLKFHMAARLLEYQVVS